LYSSAAGWLSLACGVTEEGDVVVVKPEAMMMDGAVVVVNISWFVFSEL
jgi:hypothetical protein